MDNRGKRRIQRGIAGRVENRRERSGGVDPCLNADEGTTSADVCPGDDGPGVPRTTGV